MAYNGPPPRRRTDVLTRSNQTSPLDGAALAAARLNAPLRGDDLAEAIAEVEPLLRSMQPRLKAVERALSACPGSGQTLDEVFAGISAGERNFTLQMTQVLTNRPDVMRKARIALQQYRMAAQSFQEAQEVQAQFQAAGLAIGRVEGFSLTKFRGAIHPLYNFYRVFQGVPHFEPLFPPLEGPATTRPLRPTGALVPSKAPPEEPAPFGKLSQLLKENPRLASVEPVLQQGIEWLQKAQSAAPGMLTQAMAKFKNRRPQEAAQTTPLAEPPIESPEAEAEAPEDPD